MPGAPKKAPRKALKYSFTNGIRKLSEAKIVRVKRLFSFGFFLYLHIALIRARILSF